MKRLVVLMILISGFGLSQAQKFAFVDTEYILNNIPAYKAAQDQLDKYSAELQKEVENKYSEIDEMYKKFQAEKVLLSDEMKAKKEDDIVAREKEVKDLQKKYFGSDGTLFKKREELVKPIQDEIYNAVKEIAAEGGFAAIYDTSADASILFSDPKFDKSDQVLQKLGYKN
jgi:outer membrane protein